MKILFVSNSSKQSVITIHKEQESFGVADYNFEIHLFNHDSGHTEMWSSAMDYARALELHRQLCMKCYIKTNL